jgi:ADP-heptose:LPS heptosyltransferase
MGDVIMTVPVVRAFLASYPDEELIIVTKRPFDLFFNNIPGIKVIVALHHDRHKGIAGLFRLFIEIRKDYKITAVADLHNVLRSQVLRFLFRLTGCRVAMIDKGRLEKRRLVRGKIHKPLKHTVIRYAETLARVGYPVKMTSGPWLMPSAEAVERIASYIPGPEYKLVGVAPLAKHPLKMWPVASMISFLNGLSQKENIRIFLFGSPDEATELEELAKKIPDCISIAGKIRLAEEMALISKLDLMVAMDSSNMHLASTMGVKTLSIWGATHPWAGFSAWDVDRKNSIQIPVEELTCRPCTIFGKGDCRRGDLACLNWLRADTVLKKAIELLDNR